MSNRPGEIATQPGVLRPWRPPARGAAGALRATGLPQALRLAGFAAGALWDGLSAQARGRLRGDDAGARRARAAERIARRAARTLGALKGVYAKLGQFAALRLDLLPPGAGGALAALRDRVPPLPARQLRRVVERELGAPLHALFTAFDETPLGAASIAQVHRASLPDGGLVAVKVQYPWLEASLPADLRIARFLIGVFSRIQGSAARQRERLFDEFAEGLRDELDFEREARVGREIARNLADEARVVVPEVVDSRSGRRVLTVRYHPAVPVSDRAGLERLGVSPRAVLEILSRAYATQIFVDGLFHADPHPGNLFVLDEPGASEAPRVLFVDFGLSRCLDDGLRRELRQGLFALMQRDVDAFVAGMQRMQMIAPGAEDGVRRAVTDMFARIQGRGGALALDGDQVLSLKDEAKALLQETPGLSLPNDLLLYAKTLSYLFTLGRELDPEVDMMKLSLPYALRFLAQREA